MAKLKNSKPKAGMKLHQWIATGGKPSERKNSNYKRTNGK